MLKTGKVDTEGCRGSKWHKTEFCNIFEVTYSTYYPDCSPRHCYWRDDFVLCQASYSNHCWSAKSHGGIWEMNWNNCKGLTCRRFYNWIGPLQISRNFENFYSVILIAHNGKVLDLEICHMLFKRFTPQVMDSHFGSPLV